MARATAPKKKNDNPGIAVALMSFGNERRTVNTGDRFRADDPIVTANPSWFCDESIPEHERPSLWSFVSDPPDHRSPAAVAPPPPRDQLLVRATVDLYLDGGFAPGNGAKRGASGFGASVRRGQLVDIRHPFVRQNPTLFVIPERAVTLADVERAEKEAT